ncbi:MAG TPA: DUF3558 domain-containing protein [Pseudonocardia sp.]|uniref:DUF3558 domain-containing protein n=1 Tax=Pseudonocardia sp. TaxID=60912 RepID=UPI002ED8C565
MTDRCTRRLAASASAVLLIAIAGCGPAARPAESVPAPDAPASPQTTSPLPPRPAELKLDGVDPCALLTAAQQSQLGVEQAGRDDSSDELASRACQWDNNGGKPDNGWVVRLIVKRGADYALGSTSGVQVVQVDGFSAVQTAAPYQDPKANCVLVVDVAQGQSLGVQYLNLAGDYPGISHEVACQLDRRAAEFMVQNLRVLAR